MKNKIKYFNHTQKQMGYNLKPRICIINIKGSTYQSNSIQVWFTHYYFFFKQTQEYVSFWPESSIKLLGRFPPQHKSQCAVKVACVLASNSSVASHRRRSWATCTTQPCLLPCICNPTWLCKWDSDGRGKQPVESRVCVKRPAHWVP